MYFAKNISKSKFQFTVGTSNNSTFTSLEATIFDIFQKRDRDTCSERIGNKLAIETTTSCQLVQNFLVFAAVTFKTF